jgi:outer membrane protein OmpA-like peptidoglycan-associated protein
MKKFIAVSISILLTSMGFQFSPSQAAVSCADGGSCQIGDIGPGGGVVFYVKSEGEFLYQTTKSNPIPFLKQSASGHRSCVINDMCGDGNLRIFLTAEEQAALPWNYLEVSPNVTSTISWNNDHIGTLFPNTKLGTGFDNTAAIIAEYPSDSFSNNAAFAAAHFLQNGLNDWWLPSMDEASLILYWADKHEQDPSNFPAIIDFPDSTWTSTASVNSTGDALSWQALNGSLTRNWWQELRVDRDATGSMSAVFIRGFNQTTETDSSSTGSATKSKNIFKFKTSSSTLSSKDKKKLSKLAKTHQGDSVLIKAQAGRMAGVPYSWVKNLAKFRALKIAKYLENRGISKASISISKKVLRIGVRPKTTLIWNPLN